MVVTLNARVDQLMIGAYAGAHEVGLYAAATRFSEVWWLLPVLLMQSLAPRFLFAPSLRAARVQRNVAWLMMGLAGAALVPCLLMTFFGGWLTGPLLGPAYAGAQAVLAVHVWIALFVFVDTAQNQWLLARGEQAVLVHKSIGALLVNVGLGLLLVPRFGAVGAAAAALAAQVWAALLFCQVVRSQRGLRALQWRALRALPRAPRVLRWLSRRRQIPVTERT
jgi:polysaccharide transporter, PST family